MKELSPNATVGEEEIKRFRIGDILFSDEQAKMFCDLALKGLRAEIGLKPMEGHCLLQVPQQTPEKPSPCAMAGYCLNTDSEGWCPACKGSGTMKGMTQGHGPDDYEIDIECSKCGGTGARTALPPSATTSASDAEDAARYRWLKDAAGQTWEGLLGAQMTGQLDKVIDANMADERWQQETRT